MTHDLNKIERMLQILEKQQMVLLADGNTEEASYTEEAIRRVRHELVLDNQSRIFRHFLILDNRKYGTVEDYIDDHTYLCHHMEIAVRQFNGRYYAVKVENPDDCLCGVLTTDAPDNYPMHRFPDDIICSQYPEIVMLKVIEDYENSEE